MTRYWITTHWPLGEDEPADPQRNIYLQAGKEDAAREVRPGDKVFIYESLTGKVRIEKFTDGTSRRVLRHGGRQGIVTAADVKGKLVARRPEDAYQVYSDGTSMNWAWEAATTHEVTGFVALKDVNRILGYGTGSVLRGFGDRNSGLKQIPHGQYESLLALFRENQSAKAPAAGGKPAPPGRWREGGGEGPEHRALKEFVAAFPAQVLREEGVTTLKMEYPFPSGD